MKSLYRISLALLPLGFLLAAGSAFAQGSGPTVTLHGDVESAYGIVNWGETNGGSAYGKASSEQWSADEVFLKVDVKINDQLTGFGAMRFWNNGNAFDSNQHAAGLPLPGGNVGGPANTPFQVAGSNVFAEVLWKPVDTFLIDFGNFAPAWSVPATEEAILFPTPVAYFIQPNAFSGFTVWAQENVFIWDGVRKVDFSYQGGGIEVGIALSPQCIGIGVASCQQAVAGANPGANQSTSTIAPHFMGKFGDLSINAQIDLMAGTAANPAGAGTSSTSGTAYAVGVSYKVSPIVGLAVDLQSLDVAKVAKLSQSVTTPGGTFTAAEDKDQVFTNYGVKVDVAGLMIQYFTSTYNPFMVKAFNKGLFQSDTVTNSVATLRYAIPTSSGVVFMPEVKSLTMGKAGLNAAGTKMEDVTDTQVDVIARIAF